MINTNWNQNGACNNQLQPNSQDILNLEGVNHFPPKKDWNRAYIKIKNLKM
jgi:hypothetical protein